MTETTFRIGILGMQGCFAPHARKLDALDVPSLRVVYPGDLDTCSALILPGGESTTMIKGMTDGLWAALKEYGRKHPVWGICAGSILLSSDVSQPKQECLGLMDTDVVRNAYGAQNESFVTDLAVDLGHGVITEEAVFIRAPRISRCGAGCHVLATHTVDPVIVRQDNLLATTFHPELSKNVSFHRYFVDMARSGQ